jgi:hypothetical protein
MWFAYMYMYDYHVMPRTIASYMYMYVCEIATPF